MTMQPHSRRILSFLFAAALFFLSASFASAQSKPDTLSQISVSRLDSLSRSVENLRNRLSLYDRSLDILERTNQQLSLWWNPYGLFISVLGILFALLAIAATFILFRQSKEYRSMIAESIASYQSILNKFIDDKKAELEAKIKEAELKLSSAGSKQRKEIEATLAELKKRKDSIETRYVTMPGVSALDILTSGSAHGFATVSTLPTSGSVLLSSDVQIKCQKCGKDFTARRNFPVAGTSTLTQVRCPHCGNGQFI